MEGGREIRGKTQSKGPRVGLEPKPRPPHFITTCSPREDAFIPTQTAALQKKLTCSLSHGLKMTTILLFGGRRRQRSPPFYTFSSSIGKSFYHCCDSKPNNGVWTGRVRASDRKCKTRPKVWYVRNHKEKLFIPCYREMKNIKNTVCYIFLCPFSPSELF